MTPLPYRAQLALLQQCEYDLALWRTWITYPRSPAARAWVARAVPERWTLKLRLIAMLGRLLPLHVSVRLLQLIEVPLRTLVMTWASHKLCRLQSQGLTVIAVAGSYGKTSVKHSLFHVLSQAHYTLMTPASVNTPLGIALVVVRLLSTKHRFFVVECGEYQPGDLDLLLRLLRPAVGILTPIGYVHESRQEQGSVADMFLEFLTSSAAAPLIVSDAANRPLLPPNAEVAWYGDKASGWYVRSGRTTLTATAGTLHAHAESLPFSLSLFGAHSAVNVLPALVVAEQLTSLSLTQLVASLAYHPPIERRAEVLLNPNGSVVIDNSYNTNPAAWRTMVEAVRSLRLPALTLITAGFVELAPTTAQYEHQQLAQDIADVATSVGIIRTRDNAALIEALHAQFGDRLVVGWSQAEVLTALQERFLIERFVWIEGGCRELYQ